MFDCLDLPARPACRAACPVITDALLARRHPGRSWLRLLPRPGVVADAGAWRTVAAYLDAELQVLADGSLLLLDLPVADVLALSARHAADYRSAALLPGRAYHD